MSKYIEPKATTWRSGPPPAVGWWPATVVMQPELLRWWSGRRWSDVVHCCHGKDVAALRAKQKPLVQQEQIKWTDRWWK